MVKKQVLKDTIQYLYFQNKAMKMILEELNEHRIIYFTDKIQQNPYEDGSIYTFRVASKNNYDRQFMAEINDEVLNYIKGVDNK